MIFSIKKLAKRTKPITCYNKWMDKKSAERMKKKNLFWRVQRKRTQLKWWGERGTVLTRGPLMSSSSRTSQIPPSSPQKHKLVFFSTLCPCGGVKLLTRNEEEWKLRETELGMRSSTWSNPNSKTNRCVNNPVWIWSTPNGERSTENRKPTDNSCYCITTPDVTFGMGQHWKRHW